MDGAIINAKYIFGTEDKPLRLRSGKDMAIVNQSDNGFILWDKGLIVAYGKMSEWETYQHRVARDKVMDASGGAVLPAFCDPHTHLVYAGSREIEYADKIKGMSYEEIARRGGGILNSADKLHATSQEALFEQAWARLDEIKSYGTGAVEIKSGYGLNTEDELKMLRVIRALREKSPLTIKSTFLGAHAVPAHFKGRQDEYVDEVINEMIPRVAAEGLADYIDVFCDQGFFTVTDTERLLMAGLKYGLIPKIHANELGLTGGIQVGVKYGALSVDHLEYTGDDEIQALSASETMPTLLPGAAFFLNLPLAPARRMIDSGLPLALASDFNPGSSPSGNMQLVWSMGCILFRMQPAEAFNAITLNSAYAMGVEDELGTISVGKRANLILSQPVPGIEYFPYSYGNNKVRKMILNGVLQQ